jgi:predicted dehydrogenase
LTTFVDGRLLDDDGSVLLELEGGAKGILFASQICAGEENNLNIRVYGEKGGFQWLQMEPNSLIIKWLDKPMETMRTGGAGALPESLAHTRIPAGHPEGYLEAFGNIYRNFAKQLQARLEGEVVDPIFDTPSVSDGVRGMNFIYKVVESNKKRDWVEM